MTARRVKLESAQHTRILESVNVLLAANTDRVYQDHHEPNWSFDFSKMKELVPELQTVSEDELFLYIARRSYPEGVAFRGLNRIINVIRDVSGSNRLKSISQPFNRTQQILELPEGWRQTEVKRTSFEGKIKLGRKTLELTPDLHHLTVEYYTHGIDMNAGKKDAVRFTFTNRGMFLSADYSPTSVPEVYTGAPYADLEEVLNSALS